MNENTKPSAERAALCRQIKEAVNLIHFARDRIDIHDPLFKLCDSRMEALELDGRILEASELVQLDEKPRLKLEDRITQAYALLTTLSEREAAAANEGPEHLLSGGACALSQAFDDWRTSLPPVEPLSEAV